MGAQYALYENPNPRKDGKKQPLHARIVPGRTVRINRIVREISESTSFSPGDIKGLLQAFADQLVSHLEDGDNVELEGLGLFTVSLQCPKVMTPRQVRAEDIQFKTVKFRCSKEITTRLRSMQVERKPGSSKPAKYTEEERKTNILNYMANSDGTMMSSEYMSVNSCTRYMALKEIKELMEEKKIVKLGRSKLAVYALPNTEQENIVR